MTLRDDCYRAVMHTTTRQTGIAQSQETSAIDFIERVNRSSILSLYQMAIGMKTSLHDLQKLSGGKGSIGRGCARFVKLKMLKCSPYTLLLWIWCAAADAATSRGKKRCRTRFAAPAHCLGPLA